MTTRLVCVSQGVTGPRLRTVFAFLGKPLHVKVASYRVQVAGSQGANYTHTLTWNTLVWYSRKFWIPESLAGDQKSAPLLRSDMFSMFKSLYHIIHFASTARDTTGALERILLPNLRPSLRSLSSPRCTLKLPLPLLLLLKQYHCF